MKHNGMVATGIGPSEVTACICDLSGNGDHPRWNVNRVMVEIEVLDRDGSPALTNTTLERYCISRCVDAEVQRCRPTVRKLVAKSQAIVT